MSKIEKNPILSLLFVIVLGTIAFFLWSVMSPTGELFESPVVDEELEETITTEEEGIILTEEEAKTLVGFSPCEPFICDERTVEVMEDNGEWIVTDITSGLRDDSVAAIKVVTRFIYSPSAGWITVSTGESYQCGRPGSSSEFQTELCP